MAPVRRPKPPRTSRALKRIVVSALLLSGCGGSPSQPDIRLPIPTLDAGSYSLRLEPGAPIGTPNFCFNGGTGVPTSAALPVTVSQNTGGWSVRPTADVDKGLIVSLHVAGASFEGTASGSALEGSILIVFGTTGDTPQQVGLSGNTVSTNTVMGYTTGKVEFLIGGRSASCTSYQWRLQPRSGQAAIPSTRLEAVYSMTAWSDS
jgi:hypothetical protein